MASSNFQQWNPPANNQETDAVYAVDSVRTGGAPVNGIFASALANKLFFQLSTMVKAIADYMVAQGQNAQDGNEPVLSANFAAAISAQISAFASILPVAFSVTPVFDASLGTNFEITLTGNVTSSTLPNTRAGQKLTFIIHQDATGNRTFVWPTNVAGPGVVDPGASNTSVQEFIVGGDSIVRPLNPMTVS